MKKNKREEDEEIRRAKANIRTGFIIAVIALTLFAVVAIVMIGLMSALGSGVRQDKDEAMRWYRMAAEHGDMDSREMMEEY